MDARREDAVAVAGPGRQDLTTRGCARPIASRDEWTNHACDANLKAQLKGYLERLTAPVELVASLDDIDESREMLALLR